MFGFRHIFAIRVRVPFRVWVLFKVSIRVSFRLQLVLGFRFQLGLGLGLVFLLELMIW